MRIHTPSSASRSTSELRSGSLVGLKEEGEGGEEGGANVQPTDPWFYILRREALPAAITHVQGRGRVDHVPELKNMAMSKSGAGTWTHTVLATTVSKQQGGYDCELVDGSLLERYQCSVCMKLLRDARLTECCGQHFCDTCFQQWFEKNKTCPHCRAAECKSMLNKEKIRDVNQLRVRCTNREKGCAWEGELGGLKDHLQSDNGCDYEIVTCDYSGYDNLKKLQLKGVSKGKGTGAGIKSACKKAMERRHLPSHRKECSYRDYKCDHCGLTDTFDAIAGSGEISKTQAPLKIAWSPHLSTCGEHPLVCPNKCGGKGIKRKDIATHRKTCPLERIGCPFKDAGCTAKVARKEMEGHLETNTQKHLMSVFTSHQKLSKQNQELKERLEKVEGKLT